MSKDKADGQEPEQSMEDILASIRKIISDDDDDVLELSDPLPDDEPESVAASSTVADEPEQHDYVAEAGDLLVVEDMDEDKEAASEAPSAAADAEVTAEDDHNHFGLVFENAPEEPQEEIGEDVEKPEVAAAPEASADAPQIGLLSPEAAALTAGALASFRSGDSISGAMDIGANGNTVEALVADLLKPMLKQWLDIHLPSMVENLVCEEIQRIQRQDKD